MLENCKLCPKNCGVNRKNGQKGNCNIGDKLIVNLISKNYWEEPCISGKNGSGTIFFAGCNLNCVFCQNYKISRDSDNGDMYTSEELAEECVKLQKEGANNINFVSPTSYIPLIKETIIAAKRKGLIIPIVYNSNGYENVEAIKELEGFIDVYLPDYKYGIDSIGEKYSKVKNYSGYALKAIEEMYRQVGNPVFNDKGIITKGVIIRHLVLPSLLDNSKKAINKLKEKFGKNIWISLMGQYIPTADSRDYPEINRKLTEEEYNEIINYFFDIGLNNGYMQELESSSEEYVPNFE